MKPLHYLIYGIIFCVYLFFTGYINFSPVALFGSGKWGPKGHSSYHK